MVIGRKLLLPTLLILTLLFAVVVGVVSLRAGREMAAEQERTLAGLERGLQDELARQEAIALALARQMANNPAVRSAFGIQDYDTLLAVSRPGLLNLRGEYRISEHQYTRAPAQVVLDVIEPENSGRDLSAMRSTLVTANTQGIEVVGLELVEYGLCVHGISPLEGHSPSGAPVHGSVEYGLRLDAGTFSDLRARYGGEWQFLVHIPAATAAGVEDVSAVQLPAGVVAPAELALQSTTLEQPIFAPAEQYRRALNGETVSGTVQTGDRSYALLSVPLKDFSGQVVGVVDIFWDRAGLVQGLTRQVAAGLLLGVVGLLATGLLLSVAIWRTLGPMNALTPAAEAVAHGDLRHLLPPTDPGDPRPDEVERLNRSLHAISEQLRRLIRDLEANVAERTGRWQQRSSRFEAAAEIAVQTSTLTEVDELLTLAVAQIRRRFDADHVGVYLLDAAGETAQLHAAAGDGAPQMLAAGRPLQVSAAGGRQGIPTAAMAAGQVIFSTDLQADPYYLPDPRLPETCTQAALPLIVADRVIGALDLHWNHSEAFERPTGESRPDADATLPALQIIADQLAVSVSRARLIERLERTTTELGETRTRQTGENWLGFVRGRADAAGYRYAPEGSPTRSSMGGSLQALNREQAAAAPDGGDLAVPIRLRGQTIGVIRMRFDTPAVRPHIEAVVEEVSARLALLLESARLLEEAQRRAQREQQINVIATQMRSSVELDGVLQNTVRELGKALGARRTFIQLGDFAASDTAGEGDGEAEA